MVDAVDNNRSISRRTVATGLAWSVPAVVAASALPAFAASEKSTLTVTWSASATTETNNKNGQKGNINSVTASITAVTLSNLPQGAQISDVVITVAFPTDFTPQAVTLNGSNSTLWSGSYDSQSHTATFTYAGPQTATSTTLTLPLPTTMSDRATGYATPGTVDVTISATATVNGSPVATVVYSPEGYHF